MTLTMTITIPAIPSIPSITSIPAIPSLQRTGELMRMLTPLAEPCLIAAVGLLGLGPIGQAVFATALKVARENISLQS